MEHSSTVAGPAPPWRSSTNSPVSAATASVSSPQDEYGLLDLESVLGTPRTETPSTAAGRNRCWKRWRNSCRAGRGDLHLERFAPQNRHDAPEPRVRVQTRPHGHRAPCPPTAPSSTCSAMPASPSAQDGGRRHQEPEATANDVSRDNWPAARSATGQVAGAAILCCDGF